MQFVRPFIIGFVLSALVFLSAHSNLFEIAELKSLDLRFQIRGAISPQAPIALISIDQDSFDELNLPWPWPRTLHAELVRKLAANSPRIIALDLLFTEPKADSREDETLAAAIRAAGNVILAAEYTQIQSPFGPRTTLSVPIPLIRKNALGYGPANVMVDRDGVVRRAELFFRFQDEIFPGFAYRIYQALGRGKNPAPEKTGSTYVMNFRGPARTYPIVPYYRILREEIDLSLFRDKIVFVGAFSPSLHDLHPTPFSANRLTSGTEIQANLLETLLADDAIRPVPGWAHGLLFFFLAAAAILAAFALKPIKALGCLALLTGTHSFASLYLFAEYQLWLLMVPSLLAMLLSYGGITLDNYIREQKERIRLRATFSRYVSADVVEEILKDRQGLGLGGKRRRITVLFSDIRGFTSISEQTAPEEVVGLLSDYLGQVTQIVFKHGGTVDKFIGDAVFAIFGAPKSQGDDALRAVRAGLEIIELAEALGTKWSKVTGGRLKIGVGINSGEAVVGSVGSEIRSDFTAIGDTVNLGARLESLTKELQVPMLISEFSAAELKGAIPLRGLGKFKLAGREAPVNVYCPEGLL